MPACRRRPMRATPPAALSALPRPRRLRAALACSIAGCAALPAAARDAVEIAPVDLSAITVSAAGFEQTVENAPASVTVIPREELEKGAFTSLEDALKGVQGVTVTGVSQEKDIQIRGLPGGYTLILVDGRRQGTRESRPNGSAGYEQSLIPPLSAIERVEVVRGPMSSLYGSDAMGGVINIITRRVPADWTGTLSLEGAIPDNDVDGADRQGGFYAAGPLWSENVGLQVWGRRYDRDEASEIDAAREADERNIGARLTLFPAEGHELQLEGGYAEASRTATAGNTLAAGEPRSKQVNDRLSWGARWLGAWDFGDTDLSFTQEFGERRTWTADAADKMIESDRSPEIMNATVDAKATIPFEALGRHTAVLGGQYIFSELTDQNPGRASSEDFTFSAWQAAGFIEDEWRVLPDLALTGGLRITEHEIYGTHLTPRAYAVWNATPALTVKGGVSTGFRAPDIRSLVDGYYYTTQRGAGVIVSNPNLEPEETLNYEIGGLFTAGDWQFGATAFRTEFSNKIESANTGRTIVVDGTAYNRWERFNVSSAVLQGVELTANWEATDTLSLRASYTFLDSEQQDGTYAGLPLTRTPEHQASLRADWETPVEGLAAWSAVNFRGPEVNAGARIGSNGTPHAYDATGRAIAYEYDGYATVDLGVSYAVAENATVKASVYNLFDEGLTAADNNAVGEGRRVWLGLDLSF